MNKLNKFITQLIVCFIVLAFLFRLTVFSWPIRDAELKQNILLCITLFLWLPFIWNLIHAKKTEITRVLKESWIIILYFAVRFLGVFLQKYNLDRSVLESLYYEFFGLVIIGYFSLKKLDNLNIVFKVYIFANLFLNILTVLIYILIPAGVIDGARNVTDWILNSTAYQTFPYSALYSNPNGAGIVTGMAIVLGFTVFKKKNVLFWLYTVFSVWFVYFQQCRSAQVALGVCVIGIFVVNILKIMNARFFTALLLILCVAAMISIGGYILKKSETVEKLKNLNSIEQQLNKSSTGRYTVWKYDINANRQNFFFGSGSIEKGLNQRKNIFLKLYENEEIANQKVEELRALDFHNGYIGTFIACGAVCFFIFVLILIQKIRKLEVSEKDYGYLGVCFMFIINLFECNFLVSTYVYSILMMLVLNISRIKRAQPSIERRNLDE